MPFKSDKQRKYLFKFKPGVAKKLAKKDYQGGGELVEYGQYGNLLQSLGAMGGQSSPGQYDDVIEQTGAGIADVVAPGSGGLIRGATGISKAIAGEGTETGRQIAGDVLNPFSQISSLAEGRFEEAVPVLGSIKKSRRLREEKRQQEDEARRLQSQERLRQSAQRLANYNRYGEGMFRYGGTLKDYMVDGGELERISQDAVRVRGDRPEMTDDVDIGVAYVDNDEVIDDENRVFSDSIPYGKGTVADEAARLEGMKSSRFPMQNEFLNRRINNLFDYQESGKQFGGQFSGTAFSSVDPDEVARLSKRHAEATTGPDKKKRERDTRGRTPGEASFLFKQRSAAPDPRNRPAGGGGGVEREASPQLKTASKKVIRKSKRMSQAGGRKAPKQRYKYGGNVKEFAKDLMAGKKKTAKKSGFSLSKMMK